MFDQFAKTVIAGATVWLIQWSTVVAFAASVAPDRSVFPNDSLTRLANRLAVIDRGDDPKSVGDADHGADRLPVRDSSPVDADVSMPVSPPLEAEASDSAPRKEKRGLPPPAETFPTASRIRTGGSELWWVVKTVVALGVVIGLILLLRVVLARVSGRVTSSLPGTVVEVLGRVSIAPRSHLLVLRLGRRILAVAETPSGLNTLADINNGEEVADLLKSIAQTRPGSESQRFSRLMGRFDSDYGDEQSIEEEGDDQDEFRVVRTRDRVMNLISRIRATAGRGDGP